MKHPPACLKNKTWTQSGAAALALSKYELIRKNNIEEKEAMLEALGVKEAKKDVIESLAKRVHKSGVKKEKIVGLIRRSGRSQGKDEVKYLQVVKRYRCREQGCKFQFDHRGTLKDHMRVKHWDTAVPCLNRGCGDSFHSLATRRDHMKKGIHTNLGTDETSEIPAQLEAKSCAVCGEKFRTAESGHTCFNNMNGLRPADALGQVEFTAQGHQRFETHLSSEKQKKVNANNCNKIRL